MPDSSISLPWALRSRCTCGCRSCYFGTLEEHRADPVTAPGALSHLSSTDISTAEAMGVVAEGEHLCMSMRGVREQQARTTSTRLAGRLRIEPDLASQLLTLARSPR